MKKYLSLILALCLPALLGGCGAVPLPMPESPTALCNTEMAIGSFSL